MAPSLSYIRRAPLAAQLDNVETRTIQRGNLLKLSGR